ncbi:MAG: PilZ domain-containing protein [Candidatus Omnitrophica bacterium]|nr:PilZ domain-containing protein [Candidatus Omnitrophota bacterium]MCB9747118.1 PilZ domain-containing protein [Candidatus Omnitrophota bacterium]
MGKWDGLDRRKFPRVNYPCLVVLRNNDSMEKEVLLTHTENVGMGGICVTLKKNLKMFTPVELEVDLLDLSDHIKCNGKVVWNVQRKINERKKPLFYDIGIEFVDIDKKELNRLEDIITRLVKNKAEIGNPH